MTPRAERIARIRDLLDQRRHPERRVGLFSATNLTRLGLRFGAMAIAAGLVTRFLGTGAIAGAIALAAVAAADFGVAQLWGRIGEGVRRGYSMIGTVLALGFVLVGLVLSQSAGAREAAGTWWSGFLARQNAKVDQRVRAQRVTVDSAAAVDPHWRLLLQDGALRKGTFAEAEAWCRDLGPEWTLPPGLGQWPRLDRYPDVGQLFYVWTGPNTGIQVGDGTRPAVGVSGASRPTEVRAVLCMKGGA